LTAAAAAVAEDITRNEGEKTVEMAVLKRALKCEFFLFFCCFFLNYFCVFIGNKDVMRNEGEQAVEMAVLKMALACRYCHVSEFVFLVTVRLFLTYAHTHTHTHTHTHILKFSLKSVNICYSSAATSLVFVDFFVIRIFSHYSQYTRTHTHTNTHT
jgi:hypothetical protein